MTRVDVEGPDEHGMLYICVQPTRRGENAVVKRSERAGERVVLDYDSADNLFGIEIFVGP